MTSYDLSQEDAFKLLQDIEYSAKLSSIYIHNLKMFVTWKGYNGYSQQTNQFQQSFIGLTFTVTDPKVVYLKVH